MSASYLNNIKFRLHKQPEDHEGPGKSAVPHDWRLLILIPVWVTLAFVISNFIVITLLWLLASLHMPLENFLRPAVLQTGIATLIYITTIAVVIGVPYYWRIKTTKNDLGLTRLPSWVDIGLAPVGFIVYTVIVTAILAAVVSLLPQFPINQAQDVGFQAMGSRVDNILAFVTLVVIAPFAEEVLFRGYLYGKLKKHVPVVVAAIVTSLLFGIAHLQLNVGVDVFILSLVLCALRSLTGSIWAGVLVHVLKNALAYYLLFVAPLVGA